MTGGALRLAGALLATGALATGCSGADLAAAPTLPASPAPPASQSAAVGTPTVVLEPDSRRPSPLPAPRLSASTGTQAGAARTGATPKRSKRQAQQARQTPAPTTPELPPGDPGVGAPEVPDPGAPTQEQHPHGEARTVVPEAALLDAASVGATMGGTWTTTAVVPASVCATPRPVSAVASRTSGHASGTRRIVQTVGTHDGPVAAGREVSKLASALRGCGWQLGAEPPLGEASAQLTRRVGSSTTTVLVVAAEGVTVTLVGSGGAASDALAWESLGDLALSSSCPAAPDGCH